MLKLKETLLTDFSSCIILFRNYQKNLGKINCKFCSTKYKVTINAEDQPVHVYRRWVISASES